MTFGCSPCCAETQVESVVVDSHQAGTLLSQADTAEDPEDALYKQARPTPFGPVIAHPVVLNFDATIEKRDEEKLGLDISAQDGKTLLIGEVKDGPVARWNRNQSDAGAPRIERGDRIVAVNEQSGDVDVLLGVLRDDLVALNVRIRRLLEFTVTFGCQSGSELLNLEFEDTADGLCCVSYVWDGLASRLNRRNSLDLEIRKGDIVISINAQMMKTAEDCRNFSSACDDRMAFRFRRPTLRSTPEK